MGSSVYWIEAGPKVRLAIMARPRAGDWLADEIAAWRAEKIDIVISLLEAHEVMELGLQSEAALCGDHGIAFVSFAIPDRGVPSSLHATRELARRSAEELRSGRSIAVHCRAGIGRSALLAACILAIHGHDVAAAFRWIAEARRLDVPDTDEQRNWAMAFAAQIS